MTLSSFLELLGEEIEDTYEECFSLFTAKPPSESLGFIDRESTALSITVANQDLTIHQSPGILSSSREGGTTGAVVWKVTPRFADWLCDQQNPLFVHDILTERSSVLELGSGASAVLALTLGRRVGKYFLSDQEYVLKLVQKNLAGNLASNPKAKQQQRSNGRGRKGRDTNSNSNSTKDLDITALSIDWEKDMISRDHPILQGGLPFAVVVACDCTYNESLIEPFVEACVEACSSLSATGTNGQEFDDTPVTPTLAIIVQELRSPDVFENWLEIFHKSFHTYRIPDSLLTPEINSTSGFSIHIGILRD